MNVKTQHNNSMDVRAKQLLCYHVAWLLSAGLAAVSPHVISAVRRNYCLAGKIYQKLNEIKHFVDFCLKKDYKKFYLIRLGFSLNQSWLFLGEISRKC